MRSPLVADVWRRARYARPHAPGAGFLAGSIPIARHRIHSRQVSHALKLDNLRTPAHANITFGWIRTQPRRPNEYVMTMARYPSEDFECVALPRAMRQRTNSASAIAVWCSSAKDDQPRYLKCKLRHGQTTMSCRVGRRSSPRAFLSDRARSASTRSGVRPSRFEIRLPGSNSFETVDSSTCRSKPSMNAHPGTLDVAVFTLVRPGPAEQGGHAKECHQPRHTDLKTPEATVPRPRAL